MPQSQPQFKTNKRPQPVAVPARANAVKQIPGPSRIAAAVRAEMKGNLNNLWKDFVENAWPEEHSFMYSVLNDWDQNGGGWRRRAGDLEVPLYSAIQTQMDGLRVVPVPYDHVAEIEEYLKSLRGLRPKQYDTGDCPDQRRTRFTRLLREEMERFIEIASTEDIGLLEDALVRFANSPDDVGVGESMALEVVTHKVHSVTRKQ